MSAPTITRPCTWCLNGSRRTSVQAENVALFVCIHEHMSARPLCADCADGAEGNVYICTECAAAGEHEDYAVSRITLVTSFADWTDDHSFG